MGLADAVKGVKAVLDLLKDVKTLACEAGDAKLQATLQNKVVGIQSRCLALQEQILQLRTENDSLKRHLAGREGTLLNGLNHERNAYWCGQTPYCVPCAVMRARLMPLSRVSRTSNKAMCHACKGIYSDVFTDAAPPVSMRLLRGVDLQFSQRDIDMETALGQSRE